MSLKSMARLCGELMPKDFDSSLEEGKIGESMIARWLIKQGRCVLPVYEKQSGEYKGPTLYSLGGALIAPDMLVFGNEVYFAEAKNKSAFCWYRKTGRWTTGIDLRHYGDYQKVQAETGKTVFIFFLHKPGNAAKDTPENMINKVPCGLYGATISYLMDNEDHRYETPMPGQRHGMVYWAEEKLPMLTTWEQFMQDIS